MSVIPETVTPAGLRARADMVRDKLNDGGSCARQLELAADALEKAELDLMAFSGKLGPSMNPADYAPLTKPDKMAVRRQIDRLNEFAELWIEIARECSTYPEGKPIELTSMRLANAFQPSVNALTAILREGTD